jgi:hypothetical protein
MTFADCLHVSDSEGMSSSEVDDCDEEAGSGIKPHDFKVF